MNLWYAFGAGVFIGVWLGILVLGLCKMAKGREFDE